MYESGYARAYAGRTLRRAYRAAFGRDPPPNEYDDQFLLWIDICSAVGVDHHLVKTIKRYLPALGDIDPWWEDILLLDMSRTLQHISNSLFGASINMYHLYRTGHSRKRFMSSIFCWVSRGRPNSQSHTGKSQQRIQMPYYTDVNSSSLPSSIPCCHSSNSTSPPSTRRRRTNSSFQRTQPNARDTSAIPCIPYIPCSHSVSILLYRFCVAEFLIL
ncbi:uncharacterized protein EV420DRAFT_561653 [Desarmillaria tabescens]|uniref:Uncharacterized protein n=1 Tax=Armillaria tabescens TaxID=1929756 RepID=A0AA39IZ78_ARMTA|nr:uncharacterized protein EV420DRAFT_561653 [Desarmillaria tabescens]KAK0433222.1 hypothetical protein EV420DRAFT_561653 [Desarmillaria tabescens]